MKIAVCDDEKRCRDTILEYLGRFFRGENKPEITAFTRGEKLLETYKKGKTFDLIFLDVEMDGLSGVETGEKIRKLDQDVLIIFVTSYARYVPDAFRVRAFQFLVKPIMWDEFKEELRRALADIRKNRQLYRIKNKESEVYIEIGTIMYIEVYHKLLHIHTTNGSYETSGRLNAELEKLEEYGFVKCHKSFIVNMRFVKGIERNNIYLKNRQTIPVGRTMREEAMRKFALYLGRHSI